MKSILFSLLLILAPLSHLSAQDDINQLFELKLDSVERRITINKQGHDTSYFMHFRIKNLSKDTLTFLTNTCFYYNHSTLSVGTLQLDLNAAGGCLFNSHNWHTLPPGESFSEAQWITALHLNELKIGTFESKLSIPVINDKPFMYRVDGRDVYENVEYLVFVGEIKVVETYIDNRKKKKSKRN